MGAGDASPSWNSGYLSLFIPQLRPHRLGHPPIKPPARHKAPLFDSPSISSLGNFVWAQGPRRSSLCNELKAGGSRCTVRGTRSLDLRSLRTDRSSLSARPTSSNLVCPATCTSQTRDEVPVGAFFLSVSKGFSEAIRLSETGVSATFGL